MKARISPSDKLLCLRNAKTIETVSAGQKNKFVHYWSDTSLHLLLLKSSMVLLARDYIPNYVSHRQYGKIVIGQTGLELYIAFDSRVCATHRSTTSCQCVTTKT